MATAPDRKSNLLANLRARVLRIWLAIPFGRICSMPYGNLRVTLHKNLWLTISDGQSQDALPIHLVSPELVTALRDRMTELGYPYPEPRDAAA